MKKWTKSILCLAGLVCLIAFFGKTFYSLKEGFSISRLNYPKQVDVPKKVICQESFSFPTEYLYLGRGRQCYAFESKDGKYVLKLPRTDIYSVPFWKKTFNRFNPKKLELLKEKEKRLHFILNSFQIAYTDLKNETGSLYLHLSKTENLHPNIRLKDALGRSYTLNLDQAIFLIQEKKPLMIPLLKTFIQESKLEAAKEVLESFLGLVVKRAQKKIRNKDASFLRNFSYHQGQVFQIDVGSFYYMSLHEPSEIYTVHEETRPFLSWVKEHSLELGNWFEQKICQYETSFDL